MLDGQGELQEIREILRRLLRVGVVSSTRPDAGTVRVTFGDQDDVVTWDCPVLQPKTHMDKMYWMPDVGEHVLVVSLPYGSSQGFVLGAFYSRGDGVPVQSQDKHHITYKDGSWLEYDRKSHVLSGHIKGAVNKLTVDEDVNVSVGGSVNADVGRDLSALVGKNAEIVAGAQITLTAPLINLLGNLSQSARSGGAAAENKNADTEHEGSYTLNGDLQVNGNISATGSIIDSGGNTNHHTH